MYEEQFLAEKLQQFSLLDIALVKIVYFLVGLLVATNYIVLTSVSWIFYLLMFLIAVFPIVIHLFSFEGSYIQKARKYLKTNKPSYQVLLFFSMFFFCMYISSINTSFKFSTVVCLSDINHNFCN